MESGSNYQFKGGVICKKKGLFAISVDNLLSIGLRGKNCTNAGFNMTVTNTEKQIALYQNTLNITLDPESVKKIYGFLVE